MFEKYKMLVVYISSQKIKYIYETKQRNNCYQNDNKQREKVILRMNEIKKKLYDKIYILLEKENNYLSTMFL